MTPVTASSHRPPAGESSASASQRYCPGTRKPTCAALDHAKITSSTAATKKNPDRDRRSTADCAGRRILPARRCSLKSP